MIRNPGVDVIGHPFGAYFEKYGMPPPEAVFELLKSAAAAGKAVELNVSHSDAAEFACLAAASGVDFLFWPASDAHIARHVGRCVQRLFFSNTDEPELKDI
jgi:histidinol phosphatase-like PHP family hydrolase